MINYMATAGKTRDLVAALGRHDAALARRHVEAFGGDPMSVLGSLTRAREYQLATHLGRLCFGGWWPERTDDLAVLCVAASTQK
jgi:hypothetical protein